MQHHPFNILKQARFSFKWKMASCAGLVALADFLFYREDGGWTYGLFGGVLLLAFLLHNRASVNRGLTAAIAVLTLGQCLILVETGCFLSVILLGIGLVSLSMSHSNKWHQNALFWVRMSLSWGLRLMRPLNCALVHWQKARSRYRNPNKLMETLRSWILPVCLAGVFALLFSQANPILMKALGGIRFPDLWDYLSIWRFCFWLVFAGIVTAIIRPKIKIAAAKERPRYPKPRETLLQWVFSRDAVLRSLIIFNLMFAVQNFIDMAYLWGGAELPKGITPAEYAQKGAYLLIITALLAAAFVLIAQNTAQRERLVTKLIYIWVAQNIFLVFSSVFRTLLYIEDYSLTYLRLSALIWMGLVSCGLFLIILQTLLKKPNLWLINANVLSLVGVLYICSMLNLGGMIATYNVTHAKEITGRGAELDVYYLYRLGPVALPALEYFQTQGAGYNVSEQASHYQTQLYFLMEYRLTNWRTWTFREQRLYDQSQYRLKKPLTPAPPVESDLTGQRDLRIVPDNSSKKTRGE